MSRRTRDFLVDLYIAIPILLFVGLLILWMSGPIKTKKTMEYPSNEYRLEIRADDDNDRVIYIIEPIEEEEL